jgi:DNA-binding response OmpR family regulator
MYRVLIVTENERFANSLAAALAGANVIASTVGMDLEPLEIAMAKGAPGTVVVDARGDVSLSALLHIVREQPGLEEVPIIGILSESALSSLPLPTMDDFILDPVSIPELVVRILTRLVNFQTPDEINVARAGRLEVDVDNYKARIGSKTLDLTYKEFELLRFLVTHQGRVFTREALLNRVWGYDYFGGARTVDVHIRRLRSKLGPHQSLIETVRNVGYRFSEDT